METVYGFEQTDQGLALVTEKIIAPSGKSMTLDEICNERNFDHKHGIALQQFFNDCCSLHLVFGEVNKAGIMYTEQRNDRPEFVLVDGIGEKLFIPFRAMSRRINANYVRKVENKIKTQLNIEY
ncbi:hypothetical protein GWI33_010929 [Rhynchophorus ferrugineus]|nr:hypothetical protein GWI33_010929 [Rhynchophorus ferrugineus]